MKLTLLSDYNSITLGLVSLSIEISTNIIDQLLFFVVPFFFGIIRLTLVEMFFIIFEVVGNMDVDYSMQSNQLKL